VLGLLPKEKQMMLELDVSPVSAFVAPVSLMNNYLSITIDSKETRGEDKFWAC
jgi:hypothetical protein